MDDAALGEALKALVAGKPTGASLIYGALQQLANRMPDFETIDRDDVVQDLYLKLARKPATTFDNVEKSYFAYLRTTVSRHFIDEQRKATRRRERQNEAGNEENAQEQAVASPNDEAPLALDEGKTAKAWDWFRAAIIAPAAETMRSDYAPKFSADIDDLIAQSFEVRTREQCCLRDLAARGEEATPAAIKKELARRHKREQRARDGLAGALQKLRASAVISEEDVEVAKRMILEMLRERKPKTESVSKASAPSSSGQDQGQAQEQEQQHPASEGGHD